MSTEYKYPMWFKDRADGSIVIVVSFEKAILVDSKTSEFPSGEVFKCNTFWQDAEKWEEVTNLYKNLDVNGEAPLCQHNISFNEECLDCQDLLKRINRPKVKHYQDGGIEPIDYINSHNMNFNCGCVVKYITRNGKKDGECPINDLQKAIHYINFEIERLENVSK